MTISLDMLWKVGGIAVVAIALYYRVEYLEKEIVRLNGTIEELRQDLKFTTNNLMRWQYGEYAVEP